MDQDEANTAEQLQQLDDMGPFPLTRGKHIGGGKAELNIEAEQKRHHKYTSEYGHTKQWDDMRLCLPQTNKQTNSNQRHLQGQIQYKDILLWEFPLWR